VKGISWHSIVVRRWILGTLALRPGLLLAAQALRLRAERLEGTRLNAREDVYALGPEGRVTIQVEPARRTLHFEVLAPNPGALRWRRGDGGPVDVRFPHEVDVRHDGRPVELIAEGAPADLAGVRIVVRHYRVLDKAALVTPMILASFEKLWWSGAGLWILVWALTVAWPRNRLLIK
jgi:hypothetical protein